MIEGVLTVVVTLMCWPFMSNFPATVKWLTPNEKAILAKRIRQDGMIGRMDVLNSKSVKRCLSDWKVYVR